MKRSNLPIVLIIGLLSLFYVIPSVWMLVTLIVTGNFEFPTYVFAGVAHEFGLGFFLSLALLLVPLLLVIFVERGRQRGLDQKRGLGLTLGLLVAFMLIMTLVPFISTLSKGTAGITLAAASPILVFGALPLIIVAFVVVVLTPGLLRRNGGDDAGDQQAG